MTATSHRIFACIVLLGCWPLLAPIVAASGPGSQRDNVRSRDGEGRPRIVYGSSRSSRRWLGTADGPQVAVDDGIAWRGREYHLSLTYDLVAAEEGRDRAEWLCSVSAFWDTLAIEALARPDGEAREVLALRSSRHPGYAEFRDPSSGAIVERRDGAPPPGPERPMRRVWSGKQGRGNEPTLERIRDAASWAEVHDALFGEAAGAPPSRLDVDFRTEQVLVVYAGKTVNCAGYQGRLFEGDERMTLRVEALTYQSLGESPPTRPYGVFVLPNDPRKSLVVERNVQRMIGGPPMWERWKEWKAPL